MALFLAACAASALVYAPLVVSQSQMYPLRESRLGYLGRYVDQPLAVDPDLPAAAPAGTRISQADFEEQQREILSYGADGFAFFTSARPGAIQAGILSTVSNTVNMSVINLWGPAQNDLEAFRQSVNNPRGPEINGKKLILGYWTQYHNTPEQLKAKLDEVRREVGDRFLFVAELNYLRDARDELFTHGTIPEKMIAEMKENCRAYLRVADGIYFSELILMRVPEDATLTFRHQVEFYRAVMKLAREVVDEPEFKGRKLLAMSAINGHENAYARGFTTPHDGTRTLRGCLEVACVVKPDILKLSEWDEYNENTCFRPTLYNGYATKRIVRGYLQRLRGERPAPLADDDASVPNLIVTHRKCLSPGENFYVEVLNVPDGTGTGPVAVQVTVSNERREVLKTFPEQMLAADEFSEARLELPTRDLLDKARALVVALSWRTADGRQGRVDEGLLPADFAPGNAWQHKNVKQPIRDLAKMTRAEIAWTEKGVSANLVCDEPIRYAMLLGNGDILRIHGRIGRETNFVDDETNAVFCIQGTKWQAVSRREDWFKTAHVRVPGASAARWILGCKNDDYREGEKYDICWIGTYAEPLYLSLPRRALAGQTLEVNLPHVLEGTIPLDTAYALGAYSLGATGGVQVTAARLDRQAFYPSVLNARECVFQDGLVANRDSMVYTIQVVTMSGKTWRSRPFVVEKPSGRLPRLVYDFSPVAGDVIRVQSGERRWFGMLGGPFAQAQLRNKGPSTHELVDKAHSKVFALRGTDPHPRRERLPDGTWALDFDGVDDYAAFPHETIPQFGAWRVTLEVYPTRKDGNELILAARSSSGDASLWGVMNDRGKLVVGYTGFPTRDIWVSLTVPEGLKMNAWNHLEIVRGPNTLSAALNGGESVIKPCRLPGKASATMVLGGLGLGRDDFFKGKVRNLVIEHTR